MCPAEAGIFGFAGLAEAHVLVEADGVVVAVKDLEADFAAGRHLR